MFISTTLTQQYQQSQDDPFRVLIVGAGIGGISAAQMLRKNGMHPVLIERNPDESHSGYMIALMPMVDPLFSDLDLTDAYEKHSVPFSEYGLRGASGKRIRKDAIGGILETYGTYRGIARGQLIEVLTSAGCPVSFNITVESIVQREETSTVQFRTEQAQVSLDFDLVIIAEGIHSTTRNAFLSPDALDKVDTGWGGWVVWAPMDAEMQLGEELWGKDYFMGIYPVKGQLGVFLGGELSHTRIGAKAFVAHVRKTTRHLDSRFQRCLDAVLETPDPFFWPLRDVRSPEWVFKHTLLLGDAATGFLPTAGIGAGMAMESAWVLSRMLRYARKETLSDVLRAYESAQKSRVESAQKNSRDLAKLMFRTGRLWSILRGLAMRMIPLKSALNPIRQLLANPSDPDQYVKDLLEDAKRETNGNTPFS